MVQTSETFQVDDEITEHSRCVGVENKYLKKEILGSHENLESV